MHFKWIERFNLFLLDFDGLLVDTERLHFAAYQAMCKRHGFALKWSFNDYCQIAHKEVRIAEAIYATFPELFSQQPDWNILYAEKKEAYLDLLKEGRIKLMPGVDQFLQALSQRKIKRCVVTNSLEEHVKLIRSALPILDTIPVWITREQYDRPKPAPDGYLKAIELLADVGDRIIGFEDTYRGIQSLMGTAATPILICPSDHPQLSESGLKKVSHFVTFEQAAHAQSRSFQERGS